MLESIYEGVVEISYKKYTREDDNRAGHSRQMRGEFTSSKTYSDMIKRDGIHKKRYVNHPRDQSKLTCLIRGPGHSSDECKVLSYFVSKNTKSRLNKERSQELTLKKIKRKMLSSNMQLMRSSCKRNTN